MHAIAQELDDAEKYRQLVSGEAEKSIKHLFAFLQDDHKELENLNDSFENNNGLSVGPNVSETFADFSYSEAAKRLRLALQTDEINEEEPENIIIEQEKEAVPNLKQSDFEQTFPSHTCPIEEMQKLLEFEQDKANIYAEENYLLKKQNHVLLKKLGDVINENKILQEFKLFQGNVAEGENSNKLVLELEELKNMYEAKVKSLQTQLEFFRHGKAELMEDNKSLLRKVTVLESLNEPGTSNICAKCLQEIVEPHALIESSREQLLEQVQLLENKLQKSKDVEKHLMDEIQNKIQLQEETQLEMTKAYIERDRLKDDLMTSQRRWEELLNSMDEVVTNKCQAEHQLTANKLLSIQEMNKELVSKATKLQNTLEQCEEEKRSLSIEVNELKRKCTSCDLEYNLLTDNMKINLIQSRLDGTNVQQQVERLKVELNQLEQERHAERIKLKQEIESLNKRFYESEKALLQSREEVVSMQGTKQKLIQQVGTLEQTRLQLEARLFDSMKEVKEENVERESKINRSILVIHEQYDAKISQLEITLQNYKNLSGELEEECKLLIKQFENSLGLHKSEMNKLREENRALKYHIESNMEYAFRIVNTVEEIA